MSTKGETAAITPELYKVIVTIVDDRTKDIRVTREDFNELRAIVTEVASTQRELTQAQARTEEKVGRLEGAVARLAEAQTRTEERVGRLEDALARLAEAQAKTEERVGRLEDAVAKLAEAQARTEERVGRLEDAVAKLAQAQTRTEKALTNLTQEIRRMSDTLGYGLEDLGEWVLPAYFERTYGISGVERCTRKFIKVDRKEIEVNLYAEGEREGEPIVLLGESKNRIRESEVKKFVKHLKVLEDVFDKPVFRFIFGFWAHPSAERLAKESGIEVICSYQLTR